MTSGHILGAIIAISVSGFIASSWIGWSGIFYIFGVGGIISALLMAVCGADSPLVHPSISPDERAFIAESFREVKNFTEFKVQYHAKCCIEDFTVLFYIKCFALLMVCAGIRPFFRTYLGSNPLNHDLIKLSKIFKTGKQRLQG